MEIKSGQNWGDATILPHFGTEYRYFAGSLKRLGNLVGGGPCRASGMDQAGSAIAKLISTTINGRSLLKNARALQ
jgi:hypothetical protein